MRFFLTTLAMVCFLLPSVVQAHQEQEFSLRAVNGAEGGYCVLKTDRQSGEVELITAQGALNEEMLVEAFVAASVVTCQAKPRVPSLRVRHSIEEIICTEESRLLSLPWPLDRIEKIIVKKAIMKKLTSEEGIIFEKKGRGCMGIGGWLPALSVGTWLPALISADKAILLDLGLLYYEQRNWIAERLQSQEPAFPSGCDHLI